MPIVIGLGKSFGWRIPGKVQTSNYIILGGWEGEEFLTYYYCPCIQWVEGQT